MAAALISGCGSQSGKNSTETEDNSQEPSAAGNTEEPSAETASNGEATTLSLWLTEQLHVEFYDEMEKLWNEGNPNRQIELEYTVLPYEDMHSKLLIALQSGTGAPDMADIELGKFANFLKGEPQLVALNDAIAPYKDAVVPSRLDIYSCLFIHISEPTRR